MAGELSKHTSIRHLISTLLILCVATVLTGALALGGSTANGAAPQERVGSNVHGVAAPGAPETPLTTTGRIAYYSSDILGSADIFVINPDGSGRVNLTDSDIYENQPAWSPDGSRIAYLGEGMDSQPDLFVMNSDGTNQINLTNDKLEDQSYPTWSPDGNRIAFLQQWFDGQQLQFDIFVINADGSGRVNLTNTTSSTETTPAWSHDGLKIAYYAGGDIWVMNANGTNQVSLGSGGFYPAWSSDDSLIAYVRSGGGTCGVVVWVMNANGSNAHSLYCAQGAQDSHPTWSPDDTKIAFARNQASAPGNIWVMNADGTNQVNITNGTGPYNAYPSWEPDPSAVVQVKDEDGNVLENAEVYRDSLFLGRTDSRGVVGLPSPQLNQHIIARGLVFTGPSPKANHDGWLYHVWLTNVTQENNGNQTDYTITDTNKITQTVVLKKNNAQIGLNVVGSINYLATDANLADIVSGLAKASEYLFDVTDGQMFYEKLTLYENNQNFADADIQFSPWEWPSAYPSGILISTGHLYMAGPGWNGRGQYIGGWQQPTGFRTFIHEFGHYAFGAYDEYQVLGGQSGSARCTLDQASVPEARRASIMGSQYTASELCADNNHNANTEQGQTLNESVWATFVRNWRDAGSNPRWTLRTPLTRGTVNPGPGSLLVINNLDTTIVVSPGAVCDPPIQAKVYLGNTSVFLSGVSVYLNHGSQIIYEGDTDYNGKIVIYGATPGDVLTTTGTFRAQPGVKYAASATVNNCTDVMRLEWRPINGGPNGSNAPSAFNTYWLTSRLNRALGTVTLSVHFDGQPMSAPSVSLSQDGGAAQPVSLTYDPPTHTYSGNIPYDPAHALRFLARAGVDTPSAGTVVSAYILSGAEYRASGPSIGDGVQQVPKSLPTPQWWEIFSSEHMVSLSVNATSMADGTGVMVAQTDMPPGTPPNLLAVGGPFSIEGSNPITGQVGASLNFQAELFCGLQPGSIAVYRYDPTGSTWTALSTSLNTDWNQAYINLSQWGIYAVFANPNTVATFSDVPEGSTFYDYVQWIACHGIASGYADGTFRVGNNATRGQISKMVALVYRWNLEPPSGEQSAINGKAPKDTYTFADVLPGSTFFLYIETAYGMGIFSGYPCGGANEPCDNQNRPYFRPANNATRGQIAKILSNASIFVEPVSGQTFEDVSPANTFYQYVQRMASRGIIGGYACGGVGEPCGTGNKPYFRPGSNATRGQLSKMIYLTLQPR